MIATASFAVDTAALRTLGRELSRLAGAAGGASGGAVVSGPPSPLRTGAQTYVEQNFRVSSAVAGWNAIFADISSYVSGRAADVGAHLRRLQIALSQSATNLHDTAALYESVNEEQRAGLDGLLASRFGVGAHRSASLPAEDYQPQCTRQPLARMSAPPTSEMPTGDYGLVHSILTTEWTSPSALVLQAIGECFDVDPLEFVTVRFAGDWSQVDRAAKAAEAIAWFFDGVADDIADSARGCRDHWTGPAADAAFDYLDRLTAACRAVADEAEDAAKRLAAVAEAMFEGSKEVAGHFTTVLDCIGAAIISTNLGGATSTTVVGPALAAFVDALLAARAFRAAIDALEMTQKAASRVELFVSVLKAVARTGGPGLPGITIPLPAGGQ